MQIPILLAHGALGPWDDILLVGTAVIFIILMLVSWFRSRGNDVEVSDMRVRKATIQLPSNDASRPTSNREITLELIIENRGDLPDRLNTISSDDAVDVVFYEPQNDEQVILMTGIEIPGHSTIVFDHKGYQIVLLGIQKMLSVGDTVELKLIFLSGQSIQVIAEVAANIDIEN